MFLGVDIITPAELATKDTDFFKSYRALIVGDPDSQNVDLLDPLVATAKAWSPAISGNIIIIGKTSKGSPGSEPIIVGLQLSGEFCHMVIMVHYRGPG